MKKTKKIRAKYPVEISTGILLLVFIIATLLSRMIFKISHHNDNEVFIYIGMGLIGLASTVMTVIMWEELFFQVNVNIEQEGVIFRNHKNKLKIQLILYTIIPIIFTYIFFNYEIIQIRFWGWVAVCLILPLIDKIMSGVQNYHDFLALSTKKIKFKNNEKHGTYYLETISKIQIHEDPVDHNHKIELTLKDNTSVIIDLDEMELEDYYDSIFKVISVKYKNLLVTTENLT